MRLLVFILSLLLAFPSNAGMVGRGHSQYPNIPSSDFDSTDYTYEGGGGTVYTPGTNSLYADTDNQAAFRFECAFSHFNYDDPITAPGIKGGSGHLHSFSGNWETNYASTYESLRSASGSTCAGGPLNRTAYWVPSLINPDANKAVAFFEIEFYYKSDRYGQLPQMPHESGTNRDLGRTIPLPRGLRYIFGYDVKNSVLRQPFSWECTDLTTSTGIRSVGTITAGSGYVNGTYTNVALTGGAGSGATADITVAGGVVTEVTINDPGINYVNGNTMSASAADLGGSGSGFSAPAVVTAAGGGFVYSNLVQLWKALVQTGDSTNPAVCPEIRVRLDAASCWNGQLDSTNHFDHIAVPHVDGSILYCAAPNDKGRIPFFSVLVDYARGTENFGNWYLSSDRQSSDPATWHTNGSTFHADWFGAWDYSIMDYFQSNALQIGYGSLTSTPNVQAGNDQLQNNSGGVMKDGATSLKYTGGTTGGGATPVILARDYFRVYPNNLFAIPSRHPTSTYCPQAVNFLARTSLSGTDATNVANFICGLVSDGLITGDLLRHQSCGPKFVFIYLFAGANQTDSNLNICGWLYTATPAGSPAWSQYNGYTGTTGSTTVYINTGYDLSLNTELGNQYVANDAHIAMWSNTAAADGGVAAGYNNGNGQYSWLTPRFTGDSAIVAMQEFGGLPITGYTNTDGTGFYLLTRGASNSQKSYQSNGSGITETMSNSESSGTVVGTTIYLIATHDIALGTADHGWGGQMAFASGGSNLSQADAALLCHRVNVYLTAVNGTASVC